MDAKLGSDLQRDQQLHGDDADATAAAVRTALLGLHKCLPATIVSYDAATQTAKVQPAIKRLFLGDDDDSGFVDLPQCLDCPVVFPAGGPFVLTFPISQGDECLLIFSDRAIDFWFDRGGSQEPSEFRFHDLSDGFVLAGVSSKPRFLASASTSATELRTRDGALILRFAQNKISLGVSSPQPMVGGNTAKDLVGQILDAIQAITVPTAMGPSGVPINAATFAAIKNQLATMLSGIGEVQM